MSVFSPCCLRPVSTAVREVGVYSYLRTSGGRISLRHQLKGHLSVCLSCVFRDSEVNDADHSGKQRPFCDTVSLQSEDCDASRCFEFGKAFQSFRVSVALNLD